MNEVEKLKKELETAKKENARLRAIWTEAEKNARALNEPIDVEIVSED